MTAEFTHVVATAGLDSMVVELERRIDKWGWDEPPMVLFLTNRPDEEVTYQAFEGDPYEILEAVEVPEAHTVVVSVEMWAWPPDLPEDEQIGRPSEHPDRVEIRSVVAMTRTGETVGAVRVRGTDAYVEYHCGGPLAEAMAAALARHRE